MVGEGMVPAGLEAWGGLVACRNDSMLEADYDAVCVQARQLMGRAYCRWLDASPEDGVTREGYYCTCWGYLRGENCEVNDQPWRWAVVMLDVIFSTIPGFACLIFTLSKVRRYKRSTKCPTAFYCIRVVVVGSILLSLISLGSTVWLAFNIYEPTVDYIYQICLPLLVLSFAIGFIMQIFVFEEILASTPSKVKYYQLGRKGSIGVVGVNVALVCWMTLALLNWDVATVSIVAVLQSVLIASLYFRASRQMRKMLQELAELNTSLKKVGSNLKTSEEGGSVVKDQFEQRLIMALKFIRLTSILFTLLVSLALLKNIAGLDVLANAKPLLFTVNWVFFDTSIIYAMAGLLCVLAWYNASMLERLKDHESRKSGRVSSSDMASSGTAKPVLQTSKVAPA